MYLPGLNSIFCIQTPKRHRAPRKHANNCESGLLPYMEPLMDRALVELGYLSSAAVVGAMLAGRRLQTRRRHPRERASLALII